MIHMTMRMIAPTAKAPPRIRTTFEPVWTKAWKSRVATNIQLITTNRKSALRVTSARITST